MSLAIRWSNLYTLRDLTLTNLIQRGIAHDPKDSINGVAEANLQSSCFNKTSRVLRQSDSLPINTIEALLGILFSLALSKQIERIADHSDFSNSHSGLLGSKAFCVDK